MGSKAECTLHHAVTEHGTILSNPCAELMLWDKSLTAARASVQCRSAKCNIVSTQNAKPWGTNGMLTGHARSLGPAPQVQTKQLSRVSRLRPFQSLQVTGWLTAVFTLGNKLSLGGYFSTPQQTRPKFPHFMSVLACSGNLPKYILSGLLKIHDIILLIIDINIFRNVFLNQRVLLGNAIIKYAIFI